MRKKNGVKWSVGRLTQAKVLLVQVILSLGSHDLGEEWKKDGRYDSVALMRSFLSNKAALRHCRGPKMPGEVEDVFLRAKQTFAALGRIRMQPSPMTTAAAHKIITAAFRRGSAAASFS